MVGADFCKLVSPIPTTAQEVDYIDHICITKYWYPIFYLPPSLTVYSYYIVQTYRLTIVYHVYIKEIMACNCKILTCLALIEEPMPIANPQDQILEEDGISA